MKEVAEEAAQEQGLTVSDFNGVITLDVSVAQNGDSEFYFADDNNVSVSILVFLTQEEYNRSAQQPASLRPGEVLLYQDRGEYTQNEVLNSSFSVGNLTFTTVGEAVILNFSAPSTTT